jgi:hypothetical protein
MKLLDKARQSRMQLWRVEGGPWGVFSLQTPWFTFGISMMPGQAAPPNLNAGTILGGGLAGLSGYTRRPPGTTW